MCLGVFCSYSFCERMPSLDLFLNAFVEAEIERYSGI